MEFLSNYSLFLAKLASIVFAILVVLFAFFGMFAYAKGKFKGKLDVRRLNDKYEEYSHTILHAVKSKYELRLQKGGHKQKIKSKELKRRVFVLDFNGDIRASAVEALREEVTALLTLASKEDEVLVRLESSGGIVHGYGLAASQLQRIKEANIKLLVAIDKIAASGGYLMACVADRIIAAPFAIVGSIGVLAQLPNFYRYLQKQSIDFEQITAGEYKRTLTLFGENTEKGRARMRQEVEEMHRLFKNFIKEHRKVVDIEQVATGKHWCASQAMSLRLVDELKTSDDYLLTASKTCNLYEIHYKIKHPLSKRLSYGLGQFITNFLFLRA